MTSPYKTTPLRTRNAFRLLELFPGHRDDPEIRLAIRPTNLAAAKSNFEAISYTWGAEIPRKTIHCEGSHYGELDVSLNCYTALIYLRHPCEVRILWMDAICINQADIEERNAQVRIMGKIFAAASRVVVFLGEHDPDSFFLFQHLSQTDKWIDSGRMPGELPEPTSAITGKLAKLFDRPWFSRVWVIQELLRASSILFMCGSDSASFEALDSCLFGYSIRTLTTTCPAPIRLRSHTHEYLNENFETPFETLCYLVSRTGQSQASDPRDRLLALTPLLERKPLSLENLVDYNKSVESTFEDFMLLLLEDVGLFIFSLFRRPHSLRMASWVLDFNQDSDFEHLRYWFRVYASPTTMYFRKDFLIGKSERYVDTNGHGSRLLTVNGIRYARINDVGPVMRLTIAQGKVPGTLPKDQYACINSIRLGAAKAGWPEQIVQAIRYANEEDIYQLMTGGIYGKRSSIEIESEETTAMIISLCDNSRIFVTSDGHLGVAPSEAMTGDIIIFIRGALFPWILRENKIGDWNMVCGGCFLLELSDCSRVCPRTDCRRYNGEGVHMQQIISKQQILEKFHIY